MQFMRSNGFDATELYSLKYGVHNLFPPDTLHTLASGCIAVLRNMLKGVFVKFKNNAASK